MTLTLVALAITCVAGVELGLRLTGYSSPVLGMPDSNTGWSLRPGAEGLVHGENKRGVYVRINSDGLRDREHSITKPKNTFRIAIVGDSLCEATEVPLEQTFWMILQDELTARLPTGARRVEVLNFGVAGFSTAQELVMLETKIWKYEPDAVLLAFTTSDVSENFRPLSRQPLAPYFTCRAGGLLLDTSFRHLIRYQKFRHLKSRVAQRLRTIQLLAQILKRFRDSRVSTAAYEEVYLEPADTLWEEAWSISEKLIEAFHHETKRHDVPLWVVTMSNDVQVYPDREVRDGIARRLGVPDLFYPDRRIRSVCLRNNIPVIALAEEMAEYAERNHVFLHGFDPKLGYGHWNENGHRVAADLMVGKVSAYLPVTAERGI